MIIKKEINSLYDFEAWSGGKTTLKRIFDIGAEDELLKHLEGIFEGEVDETELNDFLWFEDEQIKDLLGFDFWKYDSFEEQDTAESELDEDDEDEDENDDEDDEDELG